MIFGIQKEPTPLDVRSLNEDSFRGAQRRNRTTDTGIFSPLLYRLSYLGKDGGPSGTRTLDLPVMSRML